MPSKDVDTLAFVPEKSPVRRSIVGAGSPLSPLSPLSPFGPCGPADPFGPWGPCGPGVLAPRAPFGPRMFQEIALNPLWQWFSLMSPIVAWFPAVSTQAWMTPFVTPSCMWFCTLRFPPPSAAVAPKSSVPATAL